MVYFLIRQLELKGTYTSISLFKNYKYQMINRSSTYNLQRYNLTFVLFVGLLFSETQFIYNFSLYLPVYQTPYFTLIYFLLSTAYLFYLVLSYGLFFQKTNNVSLELYEHIVFPLSVFIITLLNRNTGFVLFKVVAILLLMFQGLLLVVKIVYFGSVTEQLAQISSITKVTRLIKMSLIAVLPLFISLRLAVVVVISLCQLLSCSAYFFKFTYQHCAYEYLVLVGVFCGFISAAEDVFESIFGFHYLFIGEIASLYFYFNEDNYLASVIQLKYINSLSHSVEIRHDDNYLAGFLFVEECLLTHKKTMELSHLAKNEGTTAASLLIEKLQSHHAGREEQSLSERQILIQSHIEGSQRDIAVSLFEVIEQRFIDTASFACFEFLISNGLQLGGQYVSRALVIYYKHVEKRGSESSALDRCKYELLYQRIVKCLPTNEDDANQIQFIEFSESLAKLNSQIETCINNEVRLIEYLTDDDKKVELFPDRRLLERHELKSRIRRSIDVCVGRSMYASSSEFKFLYVLFHTCIEKKFEGTRHSIRRLFFALDSRRLVNNTYDRNNLVVLAGFNAGQIVNSNEVFKSHFGVTMSSFSRNNISEFLPSEAQRQCHASLMAESMECKEAKRGKHADYSCLLVVEKELNNVKLKVLEDYVISTRVYYEDRAGFHYVCCLVPRNPDAEENIVTLARKDCEIFENKGFQLVLRNQRCVQQLKQRMQICQIEFNYEGYNSMSLSDKLLEFQKKEKEFKVKRKVRQQYLDEKLTLIEQKFIEGRTLIKSRFCGISIAQLCIVAFIVIMMVAMFVQIDTQVNDLSYLIIDLKGSVRIVELTSNKILLQQVIISILVQTPLFPDNICQSNGISNLSSYIESQLMTDLRDNTDKLNRFQVLERDYGSLVSSILVKKYTTIPYLINYDALITYNKYIQLMKSSVYQWIQNNFTLNNQFISNPSMFTSILLNSTIDNQNSLYYGLEISQQNFIKHLISKINVFQVIHTILISLLIIFIILLRMWDNFELINYLRIIEFITPEMLLHRMRELKYSLNHLVRLKNNRIENVDIDSDFIVAIRSDKKDVHYLPLAEFTNWQINRQVQIQNGEQQFEKEKMNLIKQQDKKHLPQSLGLRAIILNWRYVFMMVGILFALIVISFSLFGYYRLKTDSLIKCDIASQQLSRIQQKYINIIAYNWKKMVQILYNFPTGNSQEMLQEAINSLMTSAYIAKISNAYQKDISDQILYGQLCTYFFNPTTCLKYNDHILKAGFSMLLPYTIKQQLLSHNISNNYLDYLDHLCNSNWLLFEGVIPMTNAIGLQSMKLMQSRLDSRFVATTIEMCLLLGAMVLLTVVCQYQRYSREAVIREEVLSLDTVSNLYAINEFKPYFNKIYYS